MNSSSDPSAPSYARLVSTRYSRYQPLPVHESPLAVHESPFPVHESSLPVHEYNRLRRVCARVHDIYMYVHDAERDPFLPIRCALRTYGGSYSEECAWMYLDMPATAPVLRCWSRLPWYCESGDATRFIQTQPGLCRSCDTRYRYTCTPYIIIHPLL